MISAVLLLLLTSNKGVNIYGSRWSYGSVYDRSPHVLGASEIIEWCTGSIPLPAIASPSLRGNPVNRTENKLSDPLHVKENVIMLSTER